MNEIEESKEFIELQKELLRHKKLYYIDNTQEISDYDYDMLEKKSFEMAKQLGFKADDWEDVPDENEKHHVHWMVGYSNDSIYNK